MANYRLKLARTNNFKARVSPRIPAQIVGGSGIEVERTNAVYTINLNYDELDTSTGIQALLEPTTYFAFWESTGGSFGKISIDDLKLEAGLPATSTDHAIARFDGALGSIQNSGILIDDSNTLYPETNDGAALGDGTHGFSDLFLAEGGVINWDNADVSITQAGNVLSFAGATSRYQFDSPLTPSTLDGAALGSATLQWSDVYLAEGAAINFDNGDVTITQNGNVLSFAGATTRYEFDGAVTPNTDDGVALGGATRAWADLFLASGGVINWNNGDVTATHSANTLAFGGASSGYTFDAVVRPSASDAAALGSSSVMWSDLFLASGGVVNFNNSDVTITHGSNALAFAGASSGYSFDAHIDLVEVVSPSNPAANHLAVFAKDVGGNTHLFSRDSAGTETDHTLGASGAVSSIAGNTGAFTLGVGLTNTTNDIHVDTNIYARTMAAPVTLTTQTAVTFGSIPAGTFKIEMYFSGVSMNGTDVPVLYLGDAGGIENSGYSGATAATTTGGTTASNQWSAAVNLATSTGAGSNFSGKVTMDLLDASTNTWAIAVTNALGDAQFTMMGAGSKSLSAVLTQVQLNTAGGAVQFDAGKVNVSYWHPAT